jgi:hypothetical protein
MNLDRHIDEYCENRSVLVLVQISHQNYTQTSFFDFTYLFLFSQSISKYNLPIIICLIDLYLREYLRYILCAFSHFETRERTHMTINGRKVKDNLTPEQLAKLQEYGAVDFKSAGATRKTSK